jgi:hypothetical protein
MLARRSQTFQHELMGHVGEASNYLAERVAGLQRAFAPAGPAQALRRAYATVYGAVQQQAALLSYVHILRDLAIVCALFVPIVLLLLERNVPGAGAPGGH